MKMILILVFQMVFFNANAKQSINIELKKDFLNSYYCPDTEFTKLRQRNKNLFNQFSEKYEGRCPIISTDKLKITDLKTGLIKVNLVTNFYNGHQCSLIDETFKRVDGKYIFTKNEFKSREEQDICTISLEIKSSKISLSVLNRDKQGGCRVFCGARGSLDKTSFSIK